MTDRGRQRSTKSNPSRESLVDQQTTEVVLQHSLLLGKIGRVNTEIDKYLSTYNEELNEVLRDLSSELSTLKSALEDVEKRLT